jgi:hypothetical protein
MIFTGNKKTENSYKIVTMRGSFASGMSLWAVENARAQRLQGESIRNNQIIMMNYELGTVEMDDLLKLSENDC